MRERRRAVLKGSAAGLAGIIGSGTAPYHGLRNIAEAEEGDTVRVGILHSLSGTIAIIEKSLDDAELLAIAEMFCVGLEGQGDSYLTRIFERGNVLQIDRLERLPEKLPMLYFPLSA